MKPMSGLSVQVSLEIGSLCQGDLYEIGVEYRAGYLSSAKPIEVDLGTAKAIYILTGNC